jgi:hypothetical protein
MAQPSAQYFAGPGHADQNPKVETVLPGQTGIRTPRLRKARISVNSLMRRARSLFSPKILSHLQLEIPTLNPFDGVEFEPRQSIKYRSRLNIGKIIEAANESLRSSNPECYAIFLLAVAAGKKSTSWNGHLSAGRKT